MRKVKKVWAPVEIAVTGDEVHCHAGCRFMNISRTQFHCKLFNVELEHDKVDTVRTIQCFQAQRLRINSLKLKIQRDRLVGKTNE